RRAAQAADARQRGRRLQLEIQLVAGPLQLAGQVAVGTRRADDQHLLGRHPGVELQIDQVQEYFAAAVALRPGRLARGVREALLVVAGAAVLERVERLVLGRPPGRRV